MASSRLEDLTPDTRERVEALIRRAREEGLEVQVVSTLRSCADQAAIYAQGRTSQGSPISWAQGCRSWHLWGRAADLVVLDGKRQAGIGDSRYQQLGALGREVGLQWPLPKTDPGHFQFPGGQSINTLCPDPSKCDQYVHGAKPVNGNCKVEWGMVWIIGREYLRAKYPDAVKDWDQWKTSAPDASLPILDDNDEQVADALERALVAMAENSSIDSGMGLNFSDCSYDRRQLACWAHWFWHLPRAEQLRIAEALPTTQSPTPTKCQVAYLDAAYGNGDGLAINWQVVLGAASLGLGVWWYISRRKR